jgi:hypothetical protein
MTSRLGKTAAGESIPYLAGSVWLIARGLRTERVEGP